MKQHQGYCAATYGSGLASARPIYADTNRCRKSPRVNLLERLSSVCRTREGYTNSCTDVVRPRQRVRRPHFTRDQVIDAWNQPQRRGRATDEHATPNRLACRPSIWHAKEKGERVSSERQRGILRKPSRGDCSPHCRGVRLFTPRQ
jgi:hypothetical protein